MDNSWKTKHYAFFSNQQCEYFPCHKTNDCGNFNCLFCYCPLYALGDMCGGAFKYTDRAIKDCSECLFPHIRSNYPKIIERYADIQKLTEQMSGYNSTYGSSI